MHIVLVGAVRGYLQAPVRKFLEHSLPLFAPHLTLPRYITWLLDEP